MPQRLTIEPLGEHDDQFLSVWATLVGQSKPTLAAAIIRVQVRQNKDLIWELLEYSARQRKVMPDQLLTALLNNPQYLEENPIANTNGEAKSSSFW